MSRNDDNPNVKGRSGGDDPLDFGAFVSSNVQRTSELLKGESAPTEANPPAGPSRPPRPGGERAVDRARDRSYWRRQAAGVGAAGDEDDALPPPPKTSSRNRYLPPSDDEIDQFHDDNEFGGSGGGFGGFFGNLFSDDGDDGNRNRIIAAILAVLLLLAIIFGLTRIFGGDDAGDGEVSTPVPTLSTDTPSTPADGPTDLTGQTPTPAATGEPEIPRGGDNQRGDGGDTPVAEPSAIAVEDMASDVARACTGHCLVRMEGAGQEEALDAAGARVSWADGEISWVVVSPTQAELLDATHTLTLIENEPRTYNLYMVKTPEDHNQRDVITPHGEIIDESGRYYLVRWYGVPAVVKPVTDWGYAVFKLAPAPPDFVAELGTNGPASDTNGWALLEQVNPANVEAVITDLTYMGELDESGLGSRYYTYPGNQIAADYLFQELESYGLKVWFEDFIMWDGYLLVNVVAEIPGADESEVYALMSHFDTINNDNPRIAPGSDDNASGIAVTLESARILAGYKLNHPVRIAFVNAEEVGIVGSSAWARESNRNNVAVAGVFNVDSVGSIRNRPVIITNAEGTSTWMQAHMSNINETYGLGEIMQHSQSDGIVADDNFVRAEGIPAMMIARELYGINLYHHTIEDVPENVSMGGVVDTVNIVMLSVYELVK